MERKLATVLFIDLVDSTSLVSASDPEIVRRRVSEFFERMTECIQAHGGTVEKFAGDAVMAAFGYPQSHEDDAERAVRAAFAALEAVDTLGLVARAGIESGEVVVDDGDSTFATGEAVNIAARLQQSAAPGTITLGPGTRRLTVGAVEVEDTGAVEVRGHGSVWSWRAVRTLDRSQRRPQAPFVGREQELELLQNLYDRAVRDRRAHLATVFGDPGVGKSRLVTEFTDGVERAHVLTGRALPYGEGVSYLPIASMVKASAGITDDDPAAEAFEKLRLCCESEAVADLLGAALGVLGAAEQVSAGEEISWAALRWAEELGGAQPLVLIFEDLQWADDKLLDVIEHLARSLRTVPALIVCVARLELLDARPGWGGGNSRAAAIEVSPLSEQDSATLAAALLPGRNAHPHQRARLLAKAEGNPLFLEETARMLLEADGDFDDDQIPGNVQALIAARLDLLDVDAKRLLQRAAVIGRVFWKGALEELSPDLDVEQSLVTLRERDLIVSVERSAIPGDHAYTFKHVLIHDVAYGGMTKAERADHHRKFAAWVGRRAPDELVEVRAHHLDRACALLTELEGAVPADLAVETAEALEESGQRALRADSFESARGLFERATELTPSLERRYLAAHAARMLGDFGTVAAEMEDVRAEAHETGDAVLEGRALTALARVALARDGDPQQAEAFGNAALDVLPAEDADAVADALDGLAAAAWWPGDLERAEAHTRRALELAQQAGRRDLWVRAMGSLQWILQLRLSLDEAEAVLEERGPAGEGILERAGTRQACGSLRRIQGRLPEAVTSFEEARALYLDAGASGEAAWSSIMLGWISRVNGDVDGGIRRFRDAVRVLTANQDHGRLCEAERGLSEALLEAGQVEEAERYALAARSHVSRHDLTSSSSTAMTLGLVRAAQGRDDDAEELLRESLALLADTDFRLLELQSIVSLAQFLRSRERLAEADELDGRLPERIAGWLGSADTYRDRTHAPLRDRSLGAA